MNPRPAILIIEDNPVNTELFVDLLEAAGFAVLTAPTAERGIQLAQSAAPQLILMDISLPGMDGLAATAALKQNPNTEAIPVLALTAHAMKGDEEKALRAGCAAYMTKPINTREFAGKVASFIHPKMQNDKVGRAVPSTPLSLSSSDGERAGVRGQLSTINHQPSTLSNEPSTNP